jgi:hypothetical protein
LQRITFISARGQSVTAAYEKGDYFLNALEGIGGLATDIKMEKGFNQDGETVTSATFKPRDITFELGIIGSMREIYALRRRLQEVFNPALGAGTFIYENDDLEAVIPAMASDGPDFPSGERYMPGGMHIGVIRLKAAEEVFFTSRVPGYQALLAVQPLFHFILEIPLDEAGNEVLFEAGTLSSGAMTVINDGQAPSPLEITIYGPVSSPRITNETTGEYIELTVPLLANETMVIDTERGKKSAVIYRDDGTQENAFQYLSIEPSEDAPHGSTFFQLTLGENELQFSAAAGSETAVVEVRYKLKYIGY